VTGEKARRVLILRCQSGEFLKILKKLAKKTLGRDGLGLVGLSCGQGALRGGVSRTRSLPFTYYFVRTFDEALLE
jgi:hypothetical protein